MKTWYAVTGNIEAHLPSHCIWHLHDKILAIDFLNREARDAFETAVGTAAIRLPHRNSGQPISSAALSCLASSGIARNYTTYDVIVTITNNESSPLLMES